MFHAFRSATAAAMRTRDKPDAQLDFCRFFGTIFMKTDSNKSDSPVHSLMLTRRIGKESDMLRLPRRRSRWCWRSL